MHSDNFNKYFNMSNIGSYEERLKDFNWSIAENELDTGMEK